MKKGSVHTCNGCLAFEPHTRTAPRGSISFNSNQAFCKLGHDIEPIQDDVTWLESYNGECRPKNKTCQKPKKIGELVELMKEYNEKTSDIEYDEVIINGKTYLEEKPKSSCKFPDSCAKGYYQKINKYYCSKCNITGL